MPYRNLAALALAATTLAAMGCGGSSSSTTAKSSSTAAQTNAVQSALARASGPVRIGHSKPLSRAEFIAEADKVCKRLNHSAHAVQTSTLRSVGTTAARLAQYYRVALNEFARLTPPNELIATWTSIVTEIQAMPHAILTRGQFALANDPHSTVQAESQITKLQLSRLALAKRNGFSDCAEV